MKVSPMIFSAPMVRALLEGRKTQTRRIIKNVEALPNGMITPKAGYAPRSPENHLPYCPHGQPGDLIYVRENWRIGAWNETMGAIAIDYCDGPRREWLVIPNDDTGEKFNDLWIQCSDELKEKGIAHNREGNYQWQPGESPLRWRPSIHMPRWASRLTLKITNVRVERVQSISPATIIAAWRGDDYISDGKRMVNVGMHACDEIDAILAFSALWDSIHGDGAWERNDWVWVYSFDVIQQNVDDYLKQQAAA